MTIYIYIYINNKSTIKKEHCRPSLPYGYIGY